MSGVTPITLLTKPYPCPGRCIFCPTSSDQPKSYLSSEPGAARALALSFDPYLQIISRLQALEYNGHNTSKIEVIILGGTWSFYQKNYRAFFILRIFQALNTKRISIPFTKQSEFSKLKEFKKILLGSKNYSKLSLEELKSRIVKEQVKNENALHRCIGLAIERKRIQKLQELKVTRKELSTIYTETKRAAPLRTAILDFDRDQWN